MTWKRHAKSVLPVLLAAVLLPGIALGADARTRVLTWSGQAGDVSRVSVECAVGDVTVRGEPDARTITVRVTLKARRSGLPVIGSAAKGEREIAQAQLVTDRDGKTLEFELDGVEDDDRHFEERWQIVVPSRLGVEIESGVGDVVVEWIEGGVAIESGVGDVEVTGCTGTIDIEDGVGDIQVTLGRDDAGDVEVSSGVGDCEIRLAGHTVTGKGLGCDASWKGDGRTRVDAESGVGDVVVLLEETTRGRS